MRRRTAITAVSSLMVLSAGCSGASESSSNGASDGNSNNAPFKIEIKEETVVANLESENNIQRIQILSPEGSEIDSAFVTGAATQVELMDVGQSASRDDNLLAYANKSLQVVAFDSEGEELGRTELRYSPDVEPIEYNISSNNSNLQLTLENIGNGPAYVEPRFVIPTGQSKIKQAEVEASGEVTRLEKELQLTRGALLPKTTYEDDESDLDQFEAIADRKLVNVNNQSEFVLSDPARFLGTAEEFIIEKRGIIENVSDVEETKVLSGSLNLHVEGLADPISYAVEVTLDGFETSYRISGRATVYCTITYEPKSAEITKLEKK